MNLDFYLDAHSRFNARCSAIIYNKDKSKILLFKMDQNNYYMLPGGRIEFNESSIDSIKREIKEEIGLSLDFKLASIQENFVVRDGIQIMQYAFCFVAINNNKIHLDLFKCKDNDSQTFYWIDVSKIDKYVILPKSTKDIIKTNCNSIIHTFEND